MSFWLIPLIVLGVLLVLMGLFVLLGRIRGGRYLRPILMFLLRVPLVGKGIRRASQSALERENPELAKAMRKLQRSGADRDPQRAQKALSQLTAAERRAYMEAMQEQGIQPEATNRAQRRQMKRQRLQG